jgi:hypothetical protein
MNLIEMLYGLAAAFGVVALLLIAALFTVVLKYEITAWWRKRA